MGFELQAAVPPQDGSKYQACMRSHVSAVTLTAAVHHPTAQSGLSAFAFYLQTLVPNLEEAVPGPCCHCHAVVGHTQAAHPVVVTRQDTCGEATG